MVVKKRILVAIPAYTGGISCMTMQSLFRARVVCAKEDWSLTLDWLSGCGDLPHVRNIFLSRFRATEADELLLLDSDVGWAEGDIIKLFKHPVDFVAAAYRQKREPEQYALRRLSGSPKATSELIDYDGTPAGLMRLTRKAVDLMVNSYPERLYRTVVDGENIDAWSLFDPIFIHGEKGQPGTRLSEDLSFCHRWRALGERIWVDPRPTTFHTGERVFVGNLRDYLERQAA